MVRESDLGLICTVQDHRVTAEVTWNPGSEQDLPCCVCGGNADDTLPYEIVVDRIIEGDDTVIDLEGQLGQAVIAFVQEKLHHNKPLCNDCYERILEEDFPD